MQDYTLLWLPGDIAQELVDDGAADYSLEIRSGVDEIIKVAVESINTAAALVAVYGGLAELKRVAQKLSKRARRNGMASVTIVIDGPAGRKEKKVDLASANADDEILTFLADECGPDSPEVAG